ncbi:MAG: hypothetical protein ACREJO_10970 [Phycisphaerales bacterium]
MVAAQTNTFPALSSAEDRLFEALARGETSPAALSAALSLPVFAILRLLASPSLLQAIAILDDAAAMLERHTTRLRHNLAFKSLEQALTAAAAKDNPAEVRRIATLLLKPTPPLPDPDPEAESAERAERITKHRRAVKDDAKSEDEDAEINALAAAMVARANEPTRATDRLPSTGRCSVPATSAPQATHASAQPSDAKPGGGRKPGLVPPNVTNQTAMPVTPSASTAFTPSPASPSHAAPVQAPQHYPAQPRAA